MSRFAAIEAELSQKYAGCKLCTWLRSPDTDEEDSAYIDALLEQPVSVKGHKLIAEVLARGGVREIDEDNVRRHRRRHMEQ